METGVAYRKQHYRSSQQRQRNISTPVYNRYTQRLVLHNTGYKNQTVSVAAQHKNEQMDEAAGPCQLSADKSSDNLPVQG